MEIILNTNELGYKPFLNSNVDSIIIGLKGYCINQPFSLSIKDLSLAMKEIKESQKKAYISLNLFTSEKSIYKFKKVFPKLSSLNADAYIVSDLGILNIFKTHHLEHKVILDLQTYVTNKYSAKSLLNFGINSLALSKEITLNDILEISNYNKNKIQLLAQGFYPITYSKRPILSCFFKHFKIKNKSHKYFIKEENREEYYPLIEEKGNLSVFNNEQYSLFNELPLLLNNNISALRIDTLFLKDDEIKYYINAYTKAINLIKENKIKEYEQLKKEFNSNHKFKVHFLENSSFLLKEEK